MRRYGKRKDVNQRPIRLALEAIGVTVIDLSDAGAGVPDLMCGYRGKIFMLEIKNLQGHRNRLTPAQVDLHLKLQQCGVTVHVVTGIDDALEVFGAQVAA